MNSGCLSIEIKGDFGTDAKKNGPTGKMEEAITLLISGRNTENQSIRLGSCWYQAREAYMADIFFLSMGVPHR